uniref:Uncharacterized protein n=1 Tax=Panagrolaimus superbus TaxID=310955 RepID=A0A914YG60_9BILA
MTSPRRSPTTSECATTALLRHHRHDHDHEIFSALFKRRYNYYNPFDFIPQNSMGSAGYSSRSAPSINVEGYHFTFENENGGALRKVPCLQSCLTCDDGGYESSSQVRKTNI